MSLFEAILYGAVQGITEYLPVSSSAHLILLPHFLGTADPGLAFDVFLHLGTLLATLTYFRRDWWSIARGETPWKPIAVATIPALAMGALLHKHVETVFRGPAVLVATLSLGGLVLFLADHFRPRERTLASLSLRDALWVGVGQCFSLVPGVSRSGSTITAGRLLGFDRAAAARFSFLLSAPITGAAVVFELRKWGELANGPVGGEALLAAGLSSFLFGMLAIGGLLRLMRRFGYLSFAVYRVALALVVWRFLVS